MTNQNDKPQPCTCDMSLSGRRRSCPVHGALLRNTTTITLPEPTSEASGVRECELAPNSCNGYRTLTEENARLRAIASVLDQSPVQLKSNGQLINELSQDNARLNAELVELTSENKKLQEKVLSFRQSMSFNGQRAKEDIDKLTQELSEAKREVSLKIESIELLRIQHRHAEEELKEQLREAREALLGGSTERDSLRTLCAELREGLEDIAENARYGDTNTVVEQAQALLFILLEKAGKML